MISDARKISTITLLSALTRMTLGARKISRSLAQQR